jgi:predicted ester cyclase
LIAKEDAKREKLPAYWRKLLIDELFTTDFVRHGPPAVEGEVRGPEGFKGLVSTYHAGFPDFRVTIDDMIAEGDSVVSRWTVRGTHQGELMGNAPTGNQVAFTGYLFDRISGGKMREAVSKHSPTSAPS